jgi:4-hydroxy-tetrahydrodipicolinate reductase
MDTGDIMITVAVTGALGRMGSLIIENIGDAPDMELVAAFDIHDIGMPVGAAAGVAAGAGDVRVSDARKIDALRAAVENGVAIVLGTTGLEPYQDEIAGIIAGNVPAVIAPNFSVGVNVFWKLLAEAAAYTGDWDIEIVEAHHRHRHHRRSSRAICRGWRADRD